MKKCFVVYLLVAKLHFFLYAQEDIKIFGFVQSSFTKYDAKMSPDLGDFDPPVNINYMGINQLNIMLSSKLSEKIYSYVNLEFVNNYSSSKGFGYFSLQEAFLRYNYRDEMKFIFGMAIPSFNSFYEIYNRFPLFPYIQRPQMYETNFDGMIDLYDILPQKALLQIYGNLRLYENIKLEYAAYFGNPPNKLISSKDNDLLPGYVAYGQSASSFVSYGTRIGLSSDFYRVGFSFNGDRDNKKKFTVYDSLDNEAIIDLGEHNRYRLGADIYIEIGPFSLTAEIMSVKTKTPGLILDTLEKWSEINPNYNGKNFDKIGYFATLQYKYSDYYLFVMYDYLIDETNRFYFGLDGLTGYHVGLGYYVNEALTIKLQVAHNRGRFDTGLPVEPIRKYRDFYYQTGLSYTF